MKSRTYFADQTVEAEDTHSENKENKVGLKIYNIWKFVLTRFRSKLKFP